MARRLACDCGRVGIRGRYRSAIRTDARDHCRFVSSRPLGRGRRRGVGHEARGGAGRKRRVGALRRCSREAGLRAHGDPHESTPVSLNAESSARLFARSRSAGRARLHRAGHSGPLRAARSRRIGSHGVVPGEESQRPLSIVERRRWRVRKRSGGRRKSCASFSSAELAQRARDRRPDHSTARAAVRAVARTIVRSRVRGIESLDARRSRAGRIRDRASRNHSTHSRGVARPGHGRSGVYAHLARRAGLV